MGLRAWVGRRAASFAVQDGSRAGGNGETADYQCVRAVRRVDCAVVRRIPFVREQIRLNDRYSVARMDDDRIVEAYCCRCLGRLVVLETSRLAVAENPRRRLMMVP